MSRELPPRANLEHLKKQAKDLLDAHKRADAEALGRIRDAVPSFRGKSDDEIARAPFALHDAQSAVAREYGQKSWNDLRAAVEAQAAAGADQGLSDDLLRALMPLPFPAEVGAVMRDVASPERKGVRMNAAKAPFPESLPVIPMRDALFVPGAVGPIHVGRPSTRAAIDAALARTPQTLAIFAQRKAEQEEVDAAGLHPVGCEAVIHAHIPDGDDRSWLVVEGIRWIALESLSTTGPAHHLVARVTPVAREESDPSEVEALTAPLRARMRDLVGSFPDAARLVALVDQAPPDHLANTAIANLPTPVDVKARYAAEPKLAERLRLVSTLVSARK
ncbi:MAG TPA: LON peptidase substrate-binding domain-containing protein [Polyangiaceae bacterium]|nr:LON peptidase substrate-binding domain-containing protein [Polyangiaceae bacterium]